MMGARGIAVQMARAIAVSLIVAGAVSGTSPARAAAANCAAWTGVQPPDPGGAADQNVLLGVTVLSPCDAWAVGYFLTSGGAFQTLIVHWDGASWQHAPSPTPGVNSSLSAVAATSARNAWAVGAFNNGPGTGNKTLVLHWNGSAWKQVRSPNPGGPGHDNSLLGARAASASNAWAVGSYVSGTAQRTLVLHWNGSAWQQVKTPNPGSGSSLAGIGATSANNIWAVGSFFNGTAEQTLALHCC